jgi:glycosyltransferase involved in cell wall biosynthesis
MRSEPQTFSICIPAYNRARYLPELLDSVFAQQFKDFQVVICEDLSPERAQIAAIVRDYQARFPGIITYSENEENLGYDGNIRRLVQVATGKFCFFMGNDDLLCLGALEHVYQVLQRHQNVGVVLKGYAWFDQTPDQICQQIRYFGEETELAAGAEAIRICFRRAGVISGFIVERLSALAAATDKFDGTLYYQMHLTASVLVEKCAVATPEILVLCRNSEPPDFGNSRKEEGLYVPGRYTPDARLNMISGALCIVKDVANTRGIDVVGQVTRDYANYFYLCIRDQLNLPLRDYFRMYRAFADMGFSKYPMFHLQCFGAYILGQRRCDRIIKELRQIIGHSPQWGFHHR